MTPQVDMMPHRNPNLTVHDLALEFADLRGSQDMLQQQVSTNVQNLTSSTQALQADVRALGERMSEMARLQERQITHSEGLNRAFSEIASIAQDFKAYRERHEAENRIVSDKVTHFDGRFRGVWMAGGLVVALGSTLVGLAWNQVMGQLADLKAMPAEMKAERAALEVRVRDAHNADVVRMQRQMDDTASRVEALEGMRGAR